MLNYMKNNTPSKLKIEPLVEAVFEIRFQANTALASNILLGYLFSKLGKMPLTKLPASDIPQQLREQNPNFKYSPLIKASWAEYSLLIGDWMCAITTEIPYPGWDNFKQKLLSIADHLKESDLISKVERYSLKYVNILEADSTQDQLNLIDLNLNLGSHAIKKEPVNLRVDLAKDNFLHAIQVLSNGVLEENGKVVKKGIFVNIDSIKNNPDNDFWSSLSDNLEEIHTATKKQFFNLLRDETITLLDPIYEKE